MLFNSSSKSSCIYQCWNIISSKILLRFIEFIIFVIEKSRRWISLHEYQSKKILDENHLNVQRFQVVENPQEAQRAGEELSLFNVFIFYSIKTYFF